MVDLTVTTSLGNTYTFTTGYAGVLNQGWSSTDRGNFNGNTDYIVSYNFLMPGDVYNDFFNLGPNTIAGTIVGATLSIPIDYGDCSPEPSCEITVPYPTTYHLGSVSIDANTLNDKANNSNAAIVAALGGGTVYGDYTFNSPADYTNPFSITLDAAEISALNGVYPHAAELG